MRRGSLTIVGTGIKFGPQTTPEARAAIQQADEVLYLLVGGAASKWVGRLNRRAKTLFAVYQRGHREGKERVAIYHDMVEDILGRLRAGVALCVVFYGHPGVFVTPAHQAIQRAREEGFRATMLPGVSAEDCLFADLGIDPLEGWQSYEATRFLILPRKFDTATPLVLWQLSGLGRLGVVDRLPGRSTLKVLVDYLARFYGRRHPVVLYEASHTERGRPQIRHLPLSGLLNAKLDGLPTLLVPPKTRAAPDLRMFDRLKIPRERAGAAKPSRPNRPRQVKR
jgi:precorrin-6B methylase 1